MPPPTLSLLLRKAGEIACKPIYFLLGLLSGIFLCTLIILSVPIYLFRAIVIHLAPRLRPDLGHPLDPHSAIMAGELLSSRRALGGTRSNLVSATTLDGNLSVDEFKKLITDKLIHSREADGKLKYPQFSQFPVPFLGFMFWKNDENFDINNHIKSPILDTELITDKKLNELVETLLNASHPPSRSPWEFHLLPNYSNPKLHSGEMSVLLLKIHHCVGDGHSLTRAFLLELFGQGEYQVPKPASQKRGLWSQLIYPLTIPIAAALEIAWLFQGQFKNGPWKIPDEEKSWHQFYSKSELIPIQNIKLVKNTFRVSFASVLLSTISAGISKTMEGKMGGEEDGKQSLIQDHNENMYFASVLPQLSKERRSRLGNHATAALLSLPIGSFRNSLDRLYACNRILNSSVKSVVPTLIVWFIACIGTHLRWVSRFVSRNRMIPAALSNFPILEGDFNGSLLGRKLVFSDVVVGAMEGVTGAMFTVISCKRYMRVAVTVEKGLLSRDEADALVGSIAEEIQNLVHISGP